MKKAPKPRRPQREEVAQFRAALGIWLDGYGAAVADANLLGGGQ
jgi:hypothetical protein